MFRHSANVLKEVTDYLTWNRILYHASSVWAIVNFFAATPNSDHIYAYRVNVSATDFWVEATAPFRVPQSEKIQVRLLKFCNYVNRFDRSGGYLTLDRETGVLRCQMTVPFSHDRCGRMEELRPVPAGMLNRYHDAMERLIQGTSSVEAEVKEWKNQFQYRSSSSLVSSSR